MATPVHTVNVTPARIAVTGTVSPRMVLPIQHAPTNETIATVSTIRPSPLLTGATVLRDIVCPFMFRPDHPDCRTGRADRFAATIRLRGFGADYFDGPSGPTTRTLQDYASGVNL
jgi:hypothetical protein